MHLSGLHLYPVKSCAGLAVASWPLDARGLAGDRSFMVVDAATGRFLSQREEPSLALVRPEWRGEDLALSTPGGSVLVSRRPTGPARAVAVWEHVGPARDCGRDAAALLSDHLGRAVALVGLHPAHGRRADPAIAGPEVEVGFSDGYPLLVVGEASRGALNARLGRPLPMDRFRPNLVIAGAHPFAEDGWRRIRVGGIPIDLVKPCTRCSITTVDQATGRRDGAEPLRTLGVFRRGERGVLFGQNAVHRAVGELRVGDPVVAG